MLDLLGTIAANILSLPGILGFAAGMMTRNLAIAAVVGVLIGAIETMVFAGFSMAAVEPLELVIGICVGAAFAVLGCLVRIRGATV
ncbi:hypothetical protein [Tropicimonas aquimaris]|uniref:Uncharacterized protein n=1 Tax=Tropicimonas aquimaris TaxID=914152 RepID=A0ABW3IMX7_9RHOB